MIIATAIELQGKNQPCVNRRGQTTLIEQSKGVQKVPKIKEEKKDILRRVRTRGLHTYFHVPYHWTTAVS